MSIFIYWKYLLNIHIDRIKPIQINNTHYNNRIILISYFCILFHTIIFCYNGRHILRNSKHTSFFQIKRVPNPMIYDQCCTPTLWNIAETYGIFWLCCTEKRWSHQSLCWLDLLQKGQEFVINADASFSNILIYNYIKNIFNLLIRR